MKRFATTEIKSTGTIISLVSEFPITWESLLPKVGDELFIFEDHNINDLLKYTLQKVFKTGYPTSFSFSLNEKVLSCMALRHATDSVYICWETDLDEKSAFYSCNAISENDSVEKTKEIPEKPPITACHNLRRFTDNLPLVVFEIYLFPDGKFKLGFVNKEMETFLPGHNTDAVNEDNSLLFTNVHPEDKEILMESMHKIAEQNVWDIEYRLVINGEVRWIKGYGRPEIREGYISVCTYLQDITQLKLNQDALDRDRLLLRTLIDNLPVSIFVKDNKGQKILANKLDVEYMGFQSEKEALGKTDKDIFGKKGGAWGYLQDLKIIKTGVEIIDEEGQLFYKSGDKREILVSKVPLKDEKGAIVGLIGICRDMTSIKKLEERLEIIDYANRNSNVSIYLVKEDATFYDVNEWGYQSLGYTKNEIMAMSLHDINPFYSTEQWNNHWKALKKDFGGIFYGKHKKKDGTFVDVEINLKTFSYKGKEFHCSYVTDITEKKKLDEQLKLVDHAFRSAALPMYFMTRNGTIYDYNTAASKTLGYDNSELGNATIYDISIRHTPESWKIRWEEIKAGQTQPYRTKLKKKDKSLLNVDISTNIFEYEGKELTFTSFIDVTEKTKLENKLNLVDFAFRNAAIPMTFIKEDGSFYDFNDATCNLLGYTKQEFIKLNMPAINPSFEWAMWIKSWNDIKRKGGAPFYTSLKKKDGKLIEVEVRANIINYENLEINCTTYIDITERNKVLEELKRSNIRYEYATIATSDVIWEADLESNYFFLSNNFEKLFGHKVTYTEDCLNNRWRNNIHSDDIQYVLEETDSIIKNNLATNWISEYRIKKSDNNYAVIQDKIFCVRDKAGKAVRLVGAMQDITNKRMEEERLKLLEKVITETTQSIVIAEAISGNDTPIVYANNSFTKVTGYTLEEVKGRNPRFLHKYIDTSNDENRRLMRNSIQKFLPWKVEVVNTKKNGERFWAEVSGFPVYDNNKEKYTHWVAIQTDITARKNAEAEKEQLVNELVENNKELKHFGYITSHNLRAPLTNLVSICNLIDTSQIPDLRTKKLINGFKLSTMLLNDTLNDLIKVLFIKENTNLNKEEILFVDVLDKVKNAISSILLRNAVKIEADFSTCKSVNFVYVYLESIFLNLITNAVKYSSPSRHPIITIKSSLDADGHTRLSFTDNGIGMNMERIKNKIFGLYQRFHNNPDGKGIGLYLVHSQISALGGSIDVESEENIGTTFTIHFK